MALSAGRRKQLEEAKKKAKNNNVKSDAVQNKSSAAKSQPARVQSGAEASRRENARKNYSTYNDLVSRGTGVSASSSYLSDLMNETGINPRRSTPFINYSHGYTPYKSQNTGNKTFMLSNGEEYGAKIRRDKEDRHRYIADTARAARYTSDDLKELYRQAIKEIDSDSTLSELERERRRQRAANLAIGTGYDEMKKSYLKKMTDTSLSDSERLGAYADYKTAERNLAKFKVKTEDDDVRSYKKQLAAENIKESKYIPEAFGGAKKDGKSGIENVKTGSKYMGKFLDTPFYEGTYGEYNKASMQYNYVLKQIKPLIDMENEIAKNPSAEQHYREKLNSDEAFRGEIQKSYEAYKKYAPMFETLQGNLETSGKAAEKQFLKDELGLLGTDTGQLNLYINKIKDEMSPQTADGKYDAKKADDIIKTVSEGRSLAKQREGGDPFLEIWQRGSLPTASGTPNGELRKAYENITEEEKNIYYYTLGKYGEEQAEDYFNKLAGTKYAAAMEKYAKDIKDTSIPVLRYIERLLVRPAATAEGIAYAAKNTSDMIFGDKNIPSPNDRFLSEKNTKTVGDYLLGEGGYMPRILEVSITDPKYNIKNIDEIIKSTEFNPQQRLYLNEFKNLLTEAMTENKKGFGKALTNLAITMGDMGEAFAMGGLLSSGMGIAGITSQVTRSVMGANVFSDSYIEAVRSGVSGDKALLGSILKAVISYALEENPVSNILESKYSSNLIKQAFKSALSEGGEEFAEEELDNLIDKYYFADKSQWQQLYSQFKSAGFDDREATIRANMQSFIWQPLEAFGMGAVAGGIFSGYNAARGRIARGAGALDDGTYKYALDALRNTNISGAKAENLRNYILMYNEKVQGGKSGLLRNWNAGKALDTYTKFQNTGKLIVTEAASKDAKLTPKKRLFLANAAENRLNADIVVGHINNLYKTDYKGGDLYAYGLWHSSGNTLFIDPEATVEQIEDAMLFHELTHAAESSRYYGDYAGYVKSRLGKEEFDKRVKAAMNKDGALTAKDAEYEVIAKYTQNELFQSEDEMKKFVQSNYSIADKVINSLKDARESVYKMLGKETPDNGLRYFERALATRRAGADTGTRNAIVKLPDGRQYVQADRQVIYSNNPENWGKELENYINEEIRRGSDITIPTVDGDKIKITDDTAWKIGDMSGWNEETFPIKMDMGTHIDELLEVSKYKKNTKAGDRSNKRFQADTFDHRTAYFRDFDGNYYKLNITVGVDKNGKTAYSIGNDIQKRSFPGAHGSSTPQGRRSVSGAPDNYNTSNFSQSQDLSEKTPMQIALEKAGIDKNTFKDGEFSKDTLSAEEAEALNAENSKRTGALAGTRYANGDLTSGGEMQYNKDNQLILPKQEYAMVSSARTAKNAGLSESELKPVDYVYAADEFYVYENNSANDFTVKQKINIAGNEDLVNGVREVIDNGTVQSTDTVMRMVQEYKHTEGRYYRDNGGVKETRAYGDNAGLSSGKPEGDTIGHTDGNSQNNTGIGNNADQTETLKGTRFFDAQNSDGKIRYSKDVLTDEEAEEINAENSKRTGALAGTRYANGDLTSGGEMQYNKNDKNADQYRVMWTMEQGILDKREVATFYSKISELNNNEYRTFLQSQDGEYIFEIKDKLVYTDGDYYYPEITKVISFSNMERFEIDMVKELVYNATRAGLEIQEYVKAIQDVYGQEHVNIATQSIYVNSSVESQIGGRSGNNISNTDEQIGEIRDAKQTETLKGTRFFDAQNSDDKIHFSKDVLTDEEAEALNAENSKRIDEAIKGYTVVSPDNQRRNWQSREGAWNGGEGEGAGITLTPHDIVETLKKHFNLPINTGKVIGNNALGEYHTLPQTVRTRVTNALPTITHELGHHLDRKYKMWEFSDAAKNEILQNADADFLNQYSERQRRSEAVAEAIREYYRDMNAAREKMPTFFEELEKALSKEDLKAINKTAEAFNGYLKSSADMRASAYFHHFGEKERGSVNAGEILKKIGDKTIEDFVDRFNPIKELTNAAEKKTGKKLSAKENPYIMTMNSLNTDGTVMYIVKNSMVTMDGEKVGNGLFPILEKVKGEKRADFEDYLRFKHAIEWLTPDKNGNVKRVFPDDNLNNADTMRRNAAALEAANPEFKALSEEIYEYQRQLLYEFGVKGGLISEAQFNELQKKYPHYVPFYRKIENTKAGKVKNGYGDLGNGLKAAKGSGADISSPIEGIIRNTAQWVTLAKKNQVMNLVYDTITKNEGLGMFAEEVASDKAVHRIDTRPIINETMRAVNETGLDLDRDTLSALTDIIIGQIGDTALSIENVSKAKSGDVVGLMVNGERKFLRFNDKTLLRALSGMNSHIVMPFITGFTNVFKQLTTSGSVFFTFGSNFERDFGTAFKSTQINNPIKFAGKYAQSLFDQITNDEDFQRYLAMGGRWETNVVQNRDAMKRLFRDLKRSDYNTAVKVIEGLTLGLYDNIQSVSDIVETIPRYLEFKETYKKTGDIQQAIYDSGEVTTNFKRGGRIAKYAEPFIPYSNAAIQGTYHLANTIKEHPARTLIKLFVCATLSAIVKYAFRKIWFNDGEDDYKNLSQYQKNNFHNFYIGEGRYFSLPKSQNFAILDTYADKFIERWVDKNESAFNDMASYTLGQLLPYNFLSTVAGDMENGKNAVQGAGHAVESTAKNVILFGTIMQLAMNEDFKGSKIVPSKFKNIEPELQYDENTSWLAKKLGQAWKISPMMIDHAINSNLGWIGKINSSLGTENKDYTLGFGRKFLKDVTYSNDILNNFYDKKNDLETEYNSQKYENGQANGKTAYEYSYYNNIGDVISNLFKMVDDTNDANEKKQIRRVINNLAKSGAFNTGNAVLDKELERLFDETGGGAFPFAVPDTKVDELGYLKKLNASEYVQLFKKISDETAKEYLEIIGSDVYKKLDDDKKRNALTSFKNAVKEREEVKAFSGKETFLDDLTETNKSDIYFSVNGTKAETSYLKKKSEFFPEDVTLKYKASQYGTLNTLYDYMKKNDMLDNAKVVSELHGLFDEKIGNKQDSEVYKILIKNGDKAGSYSPLNINYVSILRYNENNRGYEIEMSAELLPNMVRKIDEEIEKSYEALMMTGYRTEKEGRLGTVKDDNGNEVDATWAKMNPKQRNDKLNVYKSRVLRKYRELNKKAGKSIPQPRPWDETEKEE